MGIVTTGHRQGFTLAETLIASTVSISLITLSAGFVHIAMFASDSARENYECGRTLARFSDVFRHDVHTALRVSTPGDDEHRICTRVRRRPPHQLQDRWLPTRSN